MRVCAACLTPRLNQSYELRPPWEQHLRYVPHRVHNGYNRSTSDKELKEVVHAWLAAQPNMFFSQGIKKLVQRWKKCIEKQGNYVEKLCYYKFSIFIEIKFVSVVLIIIDSSTYNDSVL